MGPVLDTLVELRYSRKSRCNRFNLIRQVMLDRQLAQYRQLATTPTLRESNEF